MKRVIKWFLLAVVLLAIVWMANAFYKKVQNIRATKEKIITLPVFSLVSLDSSAMEITLFKTKPLILIYFNSECDHCQYEIQDIRKNIESFATATLVFMSSESLNKIKGFARSSGLKDHENVLFTKISSADASTAFGNLSVPHIFIYGRDNGLIKEFKGETKAEAILKHLN